MAEALRGMPARVADPNRVRDLSRGRSIKTEDLAGPAEGFFKVVDADGRLVAVLKADADRKRYTYCGVFASD
jgi:hypothetical protein